MDAKKALIITWVGIGLLVAGAIGFFLGRSNFGQGLGTLNNIQGPGQGPSSGQQGQPLQGGQPGVQPPPSGGAKLE